MSKQEHGAENAPFETIVFYGTRRAANHWARSKGIHPRRVVMATTPGALRGRAGSVRKVLQSNWYASLSRSELLRCDEADEHIRIIVATGRGQVLEEWE